MNKTCSGPCSRSLEVTDENFSRYSDNPSVFRAMCKQCRNAAKRVKREAENQLGEQEESTWEETGDEAKATKTTSSPVKTLEKLHEVCNVDKSVWSVKAWGCKAWTNSMKLKRPAYIGKNSKDDPETTRVMLHESHMEQNFSVWADLVRIVPKKLESAINSIIDRMASHAPKYPRYPKFEKLEDPHLVTIDLNDVHFGKLAWEPETGSNYDLKIADQYYRQAVRDLVSAASGLQIEKFVLPLGNDLLHVDSVFNTTSSGTPQDVDGRFAKIFDVAHQAVVYAIDYLLEIAPVEVLFVPGNHDRENSFHIAYSLKGWYRNCSRVTVDDRPIPRKRVLYGKSLIGFTHGNEEKHSSLPAIMAGEWPEEWAATAGGTREWHLGHFHKSKSTSYNCSDTHDGVVVRVAMSLSGTDAWHFRKGYTQGTKAAEAYAYSKTKGLVASFVAKASNVQA